MFAIISQDIHVLRRFIHICVFSAGQGQGDYRIGIPPRSTSPTCSAHGVRTKRSDSNSPVCSSQWWQSLVPVSCTCCIQQRRVSLQLGRLDRPQCGISPHIREAAVERCGFLKKEGQGACLHRRLTGGLIENNLGPTQAQPVLTRREEKRRGKQEADKTKRRTKPTPKDNKSSPGGDPWRPSGPEDRRPTRQSKSHPILRKVCSPKTLWAHMQSSDPGFSIKPKLKPLSGVYRTPQ